MRHLLSATGSVTPQPAGRTPHRSRCVPALNGLGWHSLGAGSSTTLLHTQLIVALITLIVITVLNSPRPRFNSCLYPKRARSAASV